MATQTVTVRRPQEPANNKRSNLAPENERFMQACSDIASALIQDFEAKTEGPKPKKDVNLNSIRTQMSKKHRLSNVPALTAIIAAIPEHYKRYILPSLVAKPISTSSEVGDMGYDADYETRDFFRHCCGGGDV